MADHRSTNGGRRGIESWSAPSTTSSCNPGACPPTSGRERRPHKWLSETQNAQINIKRSGDVDNKLERH